MVKIGTGLLDLTAWMSRKDPPRPKAFNRNLGREGRPADSLRRELHVNPLFSAWPPHEASLTHSLRRRTVVRHGDPRIDVPLTSLGNNCLLRRHRQEKRWISGSDCLPPRTRESVARTPRRALCSCRCLSLVPLRTSKGA